MKGRFRILKTELDKLIIEKRKLFKNKSQFPEEKKETNIEPNNPEEKSKDIFHFLDMKYNILNNTLKKLSFIIQNQLDENNSELNNSLKLIQEKKSSIKTELSSDEKNIENNLQNIKANYDNYFQNNIHDNDTLKKNEEKNFEENLGKIINVLDISKKRDENNLMKIKKNLKENTIEIRKEINDEKNRANFLGNNTIKKYLYNINNELDKGKSFEYLKRNEYRETINSILNDILLKLGMDK